MNKVAQKASHEQITLEAERGIIKKQKKEAYTLKKCSCGEKTSKTK